MSQLMKAFSFALILTGSVSFADTRINYAKDVWGKRIIKACVKLIHNKKPEFKNPEAYCTCAAEKHLKDAAKYPKTSEQRLQWLENLYSEQLSEKDINKDDYGIAEFELGVLEACNFGK